MATVTELITEFKFEGSEQPLNKYNASLSKGIGLLAGMGAAAVASGAAVAKWASGVLQGEQALINLSDQTGVTAERLQELQYAASVSNSSAEALNTSMLELSKTIGDAAQKGSEEFARLGISVRDANGQVKDSDQVLMEVGQRFRQLGLSMSEQQSFAQALGIEPSLLTMLNKTGSEMAQLSARARELGTLTDEQTKMAETYNDSMTTMGFAIDGVRRLVAVGLGPEMMKMVETFTDLLTENRDWIVNGVRATLGVLNDFLDMLGRVWPLLAVGAGLFVALKIATFGWAGALGVLLSPAVLIAAGIAAILLIVDDLIVAFQGGESVIANFFEEFFGWDIQPVLEGIVTAFNNMVESVTTLVTGFVAGIGGIFSGIGNILTGNFSEGLDDLSEGFTIWIDSMREAFMTMFGGVFDWARDAAMGILPDWAKDLLGIDSSDTEEGRPTGQADASMRPGGGAQAMMQNNRSVNQDVQINISTSDPQRAGQAAADGLQRQMTDAQTQADRGGM